MFNGLLYTDTCWLEKAIGTLVADHQVVRWTQVEKKHRVYVFGEIGNDWGKTSAKQIECQFTSSIFWSGIKHSEKRDIFILRWTSKLRNLSGFINCFYLAMLHAWSSNSLLYFFLSPQNINCILSCCHGANEILMAWQIEKTQHEK